MKNEKEENDFEEEIFDEGNGSQESEVIKYVEELNNAFKSMRKVHTIAIKINEKSISEIKQRVERLEDNFKLLLEEKEK